MWVYWSPRTIRPTSSPIPERKSIHRASTSLLATNSLGFAEGRTTKKKAHPPRLVFLPSQTLQPCLFPFKKFLGDFSACGGRYPHPTAGRQCLLSVFRRPTRTAPHLSAPRATNRSLQTTTPHTQHSPTTTSTAIHSIIVQQPKKRTIKRATGTKSTQPNASHHYQRSIHQFTGYIYICYPTSPPIPLSSESTTYPGAIVPQHTLPEPHRTITALRTPPQPLRPSPPSQKQKQASLALL